jgi:DNA repair photolyase
MRLQRTDPGTWDTSRYSVFTESGTFVNNFSGDLTLNQIRKWSRQNGDPLDRVDVYDSEIYCEDCSEKVEERFSATVSGQILCWNCSKSASSSEQNGVQQAVDPTKAIISKSALHHKNLCNYVINVATGCSHGCKFCYVPSTPNIKMRQDMLKEQADVYDGQEEWGSYLLYRDDLPERLARKLDRKRSWEQTDDGRGVVMISSGTDCYQDRRTAQITRGCVIELVRRELPVRILTRSPAVVRDLDVFKAAEGYVTVGSSIPCLKDEQVRAIEPGAPAPSARLDALETISQAGVPVYVSMSPTYPTQSREDLRSLLKKFKERLDPDVVFHEPINPRGGNFEMTVKAAKEAGQDTLAKELRKLRDRERWVEYSMDQLTAVEELGEELNVPVHLWPDKQFVKYAGDKEDYFRRQLEKDSSPEDYPLPPTAV